MSSPAGALLAALTATALLGGCADTVDGSGRASVSVRPTTSQPGFPSTVVTTPPGESTPPPTSVTPSEPIHPAPSLPLRIVAVHAVDGARYVIRVWAEVEDETCTDHAYGQPIITFLTQHPCNGLHRILATTRVNGRRVGFNESATGFAGTARNPYGDASRFAELEGRDGTGSLNDLLREGYRLPAGPTAVPSPDAFNVLGQDEGVTVWDVWYLDGPTPYNDPALIKMTQDAFLQF